MAVILSLLGIVLAAAGVAAVGFGIPINEFTLGTTLVLAGTTALAGGLILIGLAAVVGEIGRGPAAMENRGVGRPRARHGGDADTRVRQTPTPPRRDRRMGRAAGAFDRSRPSAIDRCRSGARDRCRYAACRGRCSAAPPARSAVARLASDRGGHRGAPTVGSRCLIYRDRTAALQYSADRATKGRALACRRARRRPPVPQRGRAASRATIPAFGCSGRTVRPE